MPGATTSGSTTAYWLDLDSRPELDELGRDDLLSREGVHDTSGVVTPFLEGRHGGRRSLSRMLAAYMIGESLWGAVPVPEHQHVYGALQGPPLAHSLRRHWLPAQDTTRVRDVVEQYIREHERGEAPPDDQDAAIGQERRRVAIARRIQLTVHHEPSGYWIKDL